METAVADLRDKLSGGLNAEDTDANTAFEWYKQAKNAADVWRKQFAREQVKDVLPRSARERILEVNIKQCKKSLGL